MFRLHDVRFSCLHRWAGYQFKRPNNFELSAIAYFRTSHSSLGVLSQKLQSVRAVVTLCVSSLLIRPALQVKLGTASVVLIQWVTPIAGCVVIVPGIGYYIIPYYRNDHSAAAQEAFMTGSYSSGLETAWSSANWIETKLNCVLVACIIWRHSTHTSHFTWINMFFILTGLQ